MHPAGTPIPILTPKSYFGYADDTTLYLSSLEEISLALNTFAQVAICTGSPY